MTLRTALTSTLFFAVAATIAACDVDPDSLTGGRNRGSAGPGADPNAEPGDPTQPGSCQEGKPHPGFGGNDFASERKPGAMGGDRRRVKPFSALRTEMARALGQMPGAMAASGAAFGEDPPRWFSEPTAGAVSIYTTYGLGFSGCYDTMTTANYAQAPTAQTAADECAKMQRKFWQRAPTAEEGKTCVALAVDGLAAEANARRRWAHVCASILASAGFTTY
jgi:hypothetical protein